jgi:mannose/cellobiose epimerase-like protein (N-acyl-D-glucosamine 2-epimerase family)
MHPDLSSARPGGGVYRAALRAELLRFAQGARHPLGFGWLDDFGTVDAGRPVELWVTARMTHVACLGALADEQPCVGGPDRSTLNALAAHGVQALRTALFDGEHGGWFAAVDAGGPVDERKQAYGHAFVVLAASSATVAGVSAAAELLDEALSVVDDRFWDEDTGMVAEEWDRAWSVLEDYRGVNANMHTVEAYLAAGDVTGDLRWQVRAGRIAERVAASARDASWRVPEHFDAAWRPLLEHNRDEPAHPFRPYGATVGHGLEWARLLVAVAESLGERAPAGLVDAAVALFDQAVADGWAVDGRDGFVYTTDWQGRPVVRSRMHWVVAEAINTAEVLHRVTGEKRYAEDRVRWWGYADRYLVDRDHGSWHHELDEENRPSARVWSGKPDVYHAYQAAILPSLPTTPSFATALARVGLR